MKTKPVPIVGIIMGCDSDWPTMKATAQTCTEFDVPFEARVVSADYTPLPVISVPVESTALKGVDALLSIVQMSASVPVAPMAIGNARNAGLLAGQIMATGDPALQRSFLNFKRRIARESRTTNARLAAENSHGASLPKKPPAPLARSGAAQATPKEKQR